MRTRWRLGLVMLAACGARVVDGSSDSGADVAVDHHDAEADANGDADAGSACTPGDYFVSVVDDAGTRVFEGGCDDGGIPDGVDVGCGMKIICASVSACGPMGSIRVQGLPTTNGSFALIWSAGADASATVYQGEMTLGAWPANPGAVAWGSFAGAIDGGASVAGSFCVLRR